MNCYNNSKQRKLIAPKDRETYLALKRAARADEDGDTPLAQALRQVYDPTFDMSVYKADFRIISIYRECRITADGIVKVSVIYAGGFSDGFFVTEPWCESAICGVMETTGMTYIEAAEGLINFIAEKKRREKV